MPRQTLTTDTLKNELSKGIQSILNAKAIAITSDIDGFYIESLDIAEKVIRFALRYGKQEVEQRGQS